jgi:hypothetical protein
MSVRTFDFKQVILTVGGIPISGYTEGTAIEIIRNNPTWAIVVGSDGLVTRGKTNDFSGTLTITLKQSSPSNDVLSGFLALDEATNSGVVPVLVKDLSGNSIYFSARAWITQYPTSTFGKDISDRVWAMSLDEADMFVGSNSLS